MSLVHVYPVSEELEHNSKSGIDCWCEPEIIDCGLDSSGNPARVFVHRKIGGII